MEISICERDLNSLIEIIKDVFDVECEHKCWPPENFTTIFHYKDFEVKICTYVDKYRENYENHGIVYIEIKDERIKENENLKKFVYQSGFILDVMRFFNDISYNEKFNKELYKEYLYIIKKYMDEDKVYSILYDTHNKKCYRLYGKELKELKYYGSSADDHIFYTNLFGRKGARKLMSFKRSIFEEDCRYDIERLRNGYKNPKVLDDFSYLKKCIKEIFGDIKINDSTDIRQSVYSTLDFEYKNYSVEISSYYDERSGQTYNDSKWNISLDMLDKDNTFKDDLLIGTSLIGLLAINDKMSYNMKFHKKLYKKYLYKVKKYIDNDEVYTFMVNEKLGREYRLYKGEKIELEKNLPYRGLHEDYVNMFGIKNAKRVEKYKAIYE